VSARQHDPRRRQSSQSVGASFTSCALPSCAPANNRGSMLAGTRTNQDRGDRTQPQAPTPRNDTRSIRNDVRSAGRGLACQDGGCQCRGSRRHRRARESTPTGWQRASAASRRYYASSIRTLVGLRQPRTAFPPALEVLRLPWGGGIAQVVWQRRCGRIRLILTDEDTGAVGLHDDPAPQGRSLDHCSLGTGRSANRVRRNR